jgi:zinc transporter ZupT
MFAPIIIVMWGIQFGFLSILAQFTKDRDRRKKLERVISIPAALALYMTISWLMPRAHHLDELGVSSFALGMALLFFLLIPAVTYIFSPAFNDTVVDSRRPQPRVRN